MAVNAQRLQVRQLAEEIHVKKSTISRTLAVLDLSTELQSDIDEGRLSVKDAIARQKAGGAGGKEGTLARKSKPKRTKEIKISVGGYTVSVKARRLLTDELVEDALRQALAKLSKDEISLSKAA